MPPTLRKRSERRSLRVNSTPSQVTVKDLSGGETCHLCLSPLESAWHLVEHIVRQHRWYIEEVHCKYIVDDTHEHFVVYTGAKCLLCDMPFHCRSDFFLHLVHSHRDRIFVVSTEGHTLLRFRLRSERGGPSPSDQTLNIQMEIRNS